MYASVLMYVQRAPPIYHRQVGNMPFSQLNRCCKVSDDCDSLAVAIQQAGSVRWTHIAETKRRVYAIPDTWERWLEQLGQVVETLSEQLLVKEIRREEVMQRFLHYPGVFLKKICVKGNRDVGEADQLGGSA